MSVSSYGSQTPFMTQVTILTLPTGLGLDIDLPVASRPIVGMRRLICSLWESEGTLQFRLSQKGQSLFRISLMTHHFPIRSFPHRRVVHNLIYGHFLGVLPMRRKPGISDKTSTRIPIWRRSKASGWVCSYQVSLSLHTI